MKAALQVDIARVPKSPTSSNSSSAVDGFENEDDDEDKNDRPSGVSHPRASGGIRGIRGIRGHTLKNVNWTKIQLSRFDPKSLVLDEFVHSPSKGQEQR
ncbi:MAG: hypothetical protein FJ279_10060 [Planctomycetes bacterium]|nr:hypothetical protein [Planctomycetota bacterium]